MGVSSIAEGQKLVDDFLAQPKREKSYYDLFSDAVTKKASIFDVLRNTKVKIPIDFDFSNKSPYTFILYDYLYDEKIMITLENETVVGVRRMGNKNTDKAVRSGDADGTAYHLISPIGLARLAATYREGSNKYGDHNWEKGFPIGDCINHALRHINYFNAGDRSEDHLAHAAWNLFAIMHYQATHPELQSHIFTDKAKEILDVIQAPKVEKHAPDSDADPAVPV